MDISQHLILLAETSFGTGVAVGISAGLVTGILFGAAAGAASVGKKVRQKLTAAIESGDISAVDRDGKPMTASAISEWLNEKSEKA